MIVMSNDVGVATNIMDDLNVRDLIGALNLGYSRAKYVQQNLECNYSCNVYTSIEWFLEWGTDTYRLASQVHTHLPASSQNIQRIRFVI